MFFIHPSKSLKIGKHFTTDNRFSVFQLKSKQITEFEFLWNTKEVQDLKIAAACTLPCLFSQQWKIGELAWHVLEDVKMSPSVT